MDGSVVAVSKVKLPGVVFRSKQCISIVVKDISISDVLLLMVVN